MLAMAGDDAPLPAGAARILKAHDRDRYLTTLFAPAQVRTALVALYAFDCEIGRVRHVVSQPMAGLIRLQWWREALEAMAGGRPPAHPVATAMHASWPLLAPSAADLAAALDARERELEELPFADLDALDRHVDMIGGGIGRAAARAAGAGPAGIDGSGRVAIAWAILDLIRHVDADLAAGRVLIPSRLLEVHGFRPDRLDRRSTGASLAEPTGALVARGRDALRAARDLVPTPDPGALAPLLAAPLAGGYFRRLERAGFDPCARPWRTPRPLAPLSLLWYRARGRF